MTREEVYDSQIFPLMKQILEICQKNDIPFIADFALDWSESEGCHLKCTSAWLDEKLDPPDEMLMAMHILYPQ